MKQVIASAQAFLTTANKPLLVLLGSTASGKTALSIAIAKAIPSIEIINADSRQLYKHVNIGTAKITKDQMQGVPHHLFDTLELDQEISVGWYKRQVYKKIDELHARGKVPMLVGGSMLYISAVVDNFTLPLPMTECVRKELMLELDSKGLAALYAELQTIDPEAAKAIHSHNTQHILRALELNRQTGKTKQEVLQEGKVLPLYTTLQFGIRWPREQLVERIERRTEQMFEQGWIKEARGLLLDGYTMQYPGMNSMGYKECIEHINGVLTLGQLKQLITKQTKSYAKRQMTWWKRDNRIQWIDK